MTEEDKGLLEEGGEDDEPPVGVDFITFMMHAGKMDLETIVTNAVDLMAAGVDTVNLNSGCGGGVRNGDNVTMNNVVGDVIYIVVCDGIAYRSICRAICDCWVVVILHQQSG